MERISDERLEEIRDEVWGDEQRTEEAIMAAELLQLRADALVSQELSPLFDKLEQAGFSGTWSQKVDAVLNPWIAVGEFKADDYEVCLVVCVAGGKSTILRASYRESTKSWFTLEFGYDTAVTHCMKLPPLPPESEGK